MSLWDDIVDTFSNIGSGVVNLASTAITDVVNVGKSILANPLPTIETIALTATGVPYPVAAAAISAANGGSLNTIAINLATSFAGAEAGNLIGAYVGNTITDVLPEGGNVAGYNLSPSDVADLAKTVQTIVTSASAPASVVALKGGNLTDVLNAGFAGGVSGLVTSQLKDYGINANNLDGKLITNNVNAAMTAILNGNSIVGAVTNATVGTLSASGLSALASTVKTEYANISKDSDTLISLNSTFSDLQKTANDFYTNTVETLKSTASDAYKSLSDAFASIQPLEKTAQDDISAYNTNLDHYNNFTAYAQSLGRGVTNTSYAGQVIFGPYSWNNNLYGPAWAITRDASSIRGGIPVIDNIANDVNSAASTATSAINTLDSNVSAYNTNLNSYNQTISDLNSATDKYNAYVSQLQDIATQAKTLSDTITSNATDLSKDSANLATQTSAIVASQMAQQSAQSAGYADVKEMNQAVSEGFSSTDATNFKDASLKGFTDAKEYDTATANGFSDKAVYDTAKTDGFDNYQSYKTATDAGFTNATTYNDAVSKGFTDATSYQTALKEGYPDAN